MPPVHTRVVTSTCHTNPQQCLHVLRNEVERERWGAVTRMAGAAARKTDLL